MRANALQRPVHLFCLSARTASALKELARRYERHIAEHAEEEIADICFTANAGRSHFAHRLALVVENAPQLRERLAEFAGGDTAGDTQSGHAAKKNGPRVAFVFAGQSAAHPELTRPIFESQPVFRAAIEECAALFDSRFGTPLIELLYPERGPDRPARPDDTKPSAAALFAVQFALGRLWASWGAKPDAVIGYGAGALAARALAEGRLPTDADLLRGLERAPQFEAAEHALESIDCELLLEVWPDREFGEIQRDLQAAGGAGEWVATIRTSENPWHTLLQSLGHLYLSGGNIDWCEFDRPYDPRKLFLPTYPFERERCWEDPAYSTGMQEQPQDPLWGAAWISALPTLQFETKVGGGNLRFLRDHRVQGTAVLPASAYLEMALAASQQIFGRAFHAIENVTFHQAALLPEQGTRTLQVIVSPASSGSAMFQVFSLNPERGSSEWTLHASGEIRMAASEPPPQVEERNQLHQIQARAVEKGDKATFYTAVRRRGLEYGPAFQGVEWYWRCRDESLVQVRNTAAKSSKTELYQIHPALLDACLHAVAASFPKDDVSAQGLCTYVPVNISRLRLFAAPGERLFSHCVMRPGSQLGADYLEADIRILDEDNRPIGEIAGVKVKRIGGEAERESRGDFKELAYDYTWIPKPAVSQPREPEAVEAGRWLIIADRGGVAKALAKLIEAQGGPTAYRAGTAFDFPNEFPIARVSCRARHAAPPRRGDFIDHRSATSMDGDVAAGTGAGAISGSSQTPLGDGHARHAGGRSGALGLLPGDGAAVGTVKDGRFGAPRSAATRIDFDPAGAVREVRMLHEELSLQPTEREIAYRSEVRYVSRLVRRPERNSGTGRISAFPDSPSFRLDTSRPGSFENLILQAASHAIPGPGEVEIQVFAAGLNFRDVMNATGSRPGGPIPFGAECAGKVTAVGPGVVDLRIGE